MESILLSLALRKEPHRDVRIVSERIIEKIIKENLNPQDKKIDNMSSTDNPPEDTPPT